MGASAYIGRVGRLAVALGVGTAIVTGHGIASADGTDTTSSTSAASDTSDTSDTSANAGTPAKKDAPSNPIEPTASATEPTSTAKTSEPDAIKTPPKSATEPVGSGVVSAQTNTGTSHAAAPTESTGAAEPTKSTEPTAQTEPTTKNKNTSRSATDDKTTQPKTPTLASASESEPAAAVATEKQVPAPAAATAAVAKESATVSELSSTVLPATVEPVMAAARSIAVDPTPTPAAAPANPLTMVTNLVTSVVGMVLGPIVGSGPTGPAEPPMAWSMLAFARREFENFVSAVTGGATETSTPTAQIAQVAETTSMPFAAAALAAIPGFPNAGAQVSPSTSVVQWLTGDHTVAGHPLIADTLTRFGVSGTDVGTMWDNGMVDDPSTPYDEHQVLIAFGDTFGLRSVPGEDYRFNVLMRSADHVLADGIDVPDGEFGNGNWYGGMPLWDVPPGRPYEDYARRIINPESLPIGAQPGITLIPTAGISLPTPNNPLAKYKVTQYLSFMSVTNWGSPGQWTTNFSGIAYSYDNGENWQIAPTSIRYNQLTGNQNFQQAAFVRPGDGYVYSYGTPNGRQGFAYLSRVKEADILDVTKYDYYSKGSAGGWFGIGATPAGWYKNNPSAATPVFGQDQGACGVGNPGNQVSELSVQYNKQLKKYVTLYGDQFNNIVMRTSDTPQGAWSAAKVLMPQQSGGIYAPMMHPWSPSTLGTGNDLYWNLSDWSDYNVLLMKTDLTKV
jgi:hypothetical protein